jgi:VanZ family protein
MTRSGRTAATVLAVATRARRVSSRRWWVVAAAWYGLIFALTQAPGTDAASTESVLDMFALGDLNGVMRLAAHVGLFGVLAVWVYLALAHGSLDTDSRRILAAVLLTAALAVTDEAHQLIVPNRHGRPVDVFYDTVGAIVVLSAALASVARARRMAGWATGRGASGPTDHRSWELGVGDEGAGQRDG